MSSSPATEEKDNESPVTMVEGSQNSGSNSIATLPRNAEEWNQHRETITRLYSRMNLPMREVQQIMERKHGFKATKRMYVTRLKQWNICKNYKAKEKEALAVRIVKAHQENQSLANITFNNQPVKLDRILRHAKTVARSRQVKPRQSALESDTADMEKGNVGSSGVKRGNAGFLKPTYDVGRCRENHNAQNTLDVTHPRSDLEIPRNFFGRPDKVPSLENILKQTQVYFEVRLEKDFLTSTSHVQHSHVPEIAALFWTNIKSAIYFLQKGSPARSWPLLNAACQTAADVLACDPINFIREIYATITPCNTKMYSDVRIVLVRYLIQMSLVQLGPYHPITVVLQELLMDHGERQLSEIPLRLMLNIYKKNSQQYHPETFQILRALINLYREDHDLAAAERVAKDLIQMCERSFGSLSEQTIMSMTELSHTYSIQGQYDEALILAEQVNQRYREVQKGDYPTSRAAYALEGIAEVWKFKGDKEKYIYWLREALAAAWKARGGSAATMFVRDKLETLLISQGRELEAMKLREQYPEQISTVV